MVILKNIRKNNDTISADYYPEGKEPKGFMMLRGNEAVEHNNASSFAASHVKRELQRLAKTSNLPKEKTVLWY